MFTHVVFTVQAADLTTLRLQEDSFQAKKTRPDPQPVQGSWVNIQTLNQQNRDTEQELPALGEVVTSE